MPGVTWCPHVTSVTVDGSTAEVHDCQDASHAALASASTGTVIPGTTGKAGTSLIASLARGRDGRWRIYLPRPPGGAMLARVLALTVTAAAITAAALAGAAPAARAAPGGGNCGASGYPWGYDISCQTGTAAAGAPARRQPGTTGVVSTPCALYPIAGNPDICCGSARTG